MLTYSLASLSEDPSSISENSINNIRQITSSATKSVTLDKIIKVFDKSSDNILYLNSMGMLFSVFGEKQILRFLIQTINKNKDSSIIEVCLNSLLYIIKFNKNNNESLIAELKSFSTEKVISDFLFHNNQFVRQKSSKLFEAISLSGLAS